MNRLHLARLSLLNSHPYYAIALRWIMTGVVVGIALIVAIYTPLDVHPDELTHFEAFKYFQGRFFPPDIGADGVWYDRYGLSRVYYKELVYIIYGNLAKLLQVLFGLQPTFLTYRLFNIVLLCITLLVIFTVKLNTFPCDRIGFVLLCIPQIIYLYTYVNSDAWALSLSIFLFILVTWLWEQPFEHWSYQSIAGLAILTGLLLVAKQNFYLSLVLPYSLLGLKLARAWSQGNLNTKFLRLLLVWGLLILIIAAPLQIIYPISQGNYQAAIARIREEKAMPGLKPSQPTGDLQLQDQGYTYADLIVKRPWLPITAQSFWGVYGYFRVFNPVWMYKVVLYCAIGLLGLTGLTLFTTRILFVNAFLTVCLCLAPVVILLNLMLSLHNSLTIDFQPQGRYLFPSFVAIAILGVGTTEFDRPDVKRVRKLLLGLLYCLTLSSLLYFGLPKLLSTHQLFLYD